MSSFIDVTFPPKTSFGAVGGPGFMTNIASMASGAESRNQEWEFERAEYEVSHAAKLPAQYKPLQAFFRLVGGRAYSFRFKDWTDFECAEGEGFFIDSDGSPVGQQMVKRYTFGGFTIDRKITKPKRGTISINGTLGSPADGGLDYSTGIIYGGSLGSPATWSGEFDVHCRFDTDVMRAESINRNPEDGIIVTWQSIPLVEVRDD